MAENEKIQIKRPTVTIPDFVNQTVPQKQELKYPSETIPIPTRGWFYNETNPMSSGEVEVKQMTAKEEDILANQELIKKGKVLDRLIESLLVDKSINPAEILVPDKNAIFISIRRLAYGDEYPVAISCPACGGQTKVVINLSDLAYKPFDFESFPKGINSFPFTLPSGTQVTYKILNQVDEASIEAELVSLKKLSKESSSELTTRLKYMLTSVNGNPDKAAIRKFVDSPQLTSIDSLALRKHIKKTNPDVDMTFDFKCSDPDGRGCSLERRSDVPIGASFLWPDFEA